MSASAEEHAGAPAVLVTKLHPPVVPSEVVQRERLFGRLRLGRGRRLTLVACPAGFGKSTLLAAWREHEAAGRPVAWVTLDDGDDDALPPRAAAVPSDRRRRRRPSCWSGTAARCGSPATRCSTPRCAKRPPASRRT